MFFDANPEGFDFVPRENRFFVAWERSSAAADRIFAHWAFDIHDLEDRGRREIGFIPWPLKNTELSFACHALDCSVGPLTVPNRFTVICNSRTIRHGPGVLEKHLSQH
ncbi:hypothetical protein [Mesorhizobium sp. B2-3-11]|uniref:hypothetical protein n=1 Tax=Mesorhizobium sp. B2-3-11 TaxID=2589953 RepID=UPI0015E40F16|nr:hypothetical protein [Mesorhizobium sp. B2-3-11]